MSLISANDYFFLLPELMRKADRKEESNIILLTFQADKLIEYQENLIDLQKWTIELYEGLRSDLQEIKKALASMGDNPDPERKEKTDILCPVEE